MVDSDHQHIFVSGGGGTSSIAVLDYSGTVIKTIDQEDGASQMALDPSTHTLYVALHSATAISAVDTETLTETQRFSTAPYPNPTFLTLAGGKLWFSCFDPGYVGCLVSVGLDGSNMMAAPFYTRGPLNLTAGGPGNNLLAIGQVGFTPAAISVYDVSGSTPSLVSQNGQAGDGDIEGMTFDPSGDNIFVAAGAPYYVQSLATSTLFSTAKYPTGAYPVTAAVSVDDKFVAAGIDTNNGPANVLVYPTLDTTPFQSWLLLDRSQYQAPSDMAFSHDASLLFVVTNNRVTGSRTFYVLDGPERTLSVAKSGAGSGVVTSSPPGVDCGASCSSVFVHGTQVTLTAAPAQGSTFSGWSGACSGTGLCTVTMDQAQSVTATFSLVPEILSADKAGTGSGAVSSSPAGVDCGVSCSSDFDYGAQVTLTATPAVGSSFVGWSGDCSGTRTCAVTMDQARAVTATFDLVPESLGVSKAGSGTGTVSSAPTGISCGATCSGSFDYGTQVTLTAAPAQGSTFSGWSGVCSGTAACTVTMDQARAVTATFDLVPPKGGGGPSTQTLSVFHAGTGAGSVSSSPAGIDCGATCSASFAAGNHVTLTATPDPGSVFSGWSGDCSGTSDCVVTLDQARTVTAIFSPVSLTTTTVSLAQSAHVVRYGAHLTLTARVTGTPNGIVDLYATPSGGVKVLVGHVALRAGVAAFVVRPQRNTSYSAELEQGAGYAPSTSTAALVRVRPILTLTVGSQRTVTLHKHRVVLMPVTVKLKPAAARGRLELVVQTRVKGYWLTIAARWLPIGRSGSVRASFLAGKPGLHRVHAVYPAGAAYAASGSAWKTFLVQPIR